MRDRDRHGKRSEPSEEDEWLAGDYTRRPLGNAGPRPSGPAGTHPREPLIPVPDPDPGSYHSDLDDEPDSD